MLCNESYAASTIIGKHIIMLEGTPGSRWWLHVLPKVIIVVADSSGPELLH